MDPPSTVVLKDVRAGTGDKGSLTLDWNTAAPDPETDDVYAEMLTSVLNIRLTDHIREELGASYSPSAFVGINAEPDLLVETYLNVTGDPAAPRGDLRDRTSRTLRRCAPTGQTESEFDDGDGRDGKRDYTYFDNQTIGDLLAKAPDAARALITRFKNRTDVLDDVTAETLREVHQRR